MRFTTLGDIDVDSIVGDSIVVYGTIVLYCILDSTNKLITQLFSLHKWKCSLNQDYSVNGVRN